MARQIADSFLQRNSLVLMHLPRTDNRSDSNSSTRDVFDLCSYKCTMSRDSSGLRAAVLNDLSEEDRILVAFDGHDKLDVLSELGQLVISAKEDSIKKRWRFH